jgi:Arc/MetJ family transcription regulator
MRTNIDIDDDLMKAAMRATGKKTKKETVEEALRAIVRRKEIEGLLALKGKLKWEGDLDAMRTDNPKFHDEP